MWLALEAFKEDAAAAAEDGGGRRPPAAVGGGTAALDTVLEASEPRALPLRYEKLLLPLILI